MTHYFEFNESILYSVNSSTVFLIKIHGNLAINVGKTYLVEVNYQAQDIIVNDTNDTVNSP